MRLARIVRIGTALAAACLAALTTLDTSAAAASRVCRQIEAQLARADGGGGSSRARKYDAAIERQREQIAISRGQAREAGCGFALLGGNLRQCARINATIERMARNLDQLQRERGRSGGGKRKSRAALLAALDANGCRIDEAAQRRKQRRDAEVAAFLREPEEPRDRPLRRAIEEEASTRDDGEDGTYRTMCVRTCDGYFFPMSQASTLGDFTRDQKNCETSCPGTEMQVFYGPRGADNPASMISTASGAPYSALPTAFLHQNLSAQRPAGCGCNAKKNFEVVAGTPPVDSSNPSEAVVSGSEAEGGVPMPTPRPDASGEAAAPQPVPMPEQPATSFIEIPMPEKTEPAPTAAAPVELEPTAAPVEGPITDRKVRVVGPAFLPDQEGAIDLQAPGQTAVP